MNEPIFEKSFFWSWLRGSSGSLTYSQLTPTSISRIYKIQAFSHTSLESRNSVACLRSFLPRYPCFIILLPYHGSMGITKKLPPPRIPLTLRSPIFSSGYIPFKTNLELTLGKPFSVTLTYMLSSFTPNSFLSSSTKIFLFPLLVEIGRKGNWLAKYSSKPVST